jgi:hypothetical protein
VVEGLTDKLTPVPAEVPPQLTVYQSIAYPVPGSSTDMVDDEPLQMVDGDAVIPVGVTGATTVTDIEVPVL